MSAKKKARVMYMHTLDGQPASFDDLRGAYIHFASKGHQSRAAKLVASRRQIEREQQAAIAEDWKLWNEMKPEYRGARPSIARYDYVLVEIPTDV